MIEHVEAAMGLLVAVAALGALSKRVPVPLPILQVAGGAALSFVPGPGDVRVDPEVFFALFIPPLLFADGWLIPKRDVLRVMRPILLLALGLVALTVVAVGYLVHALIPAIPLAAAFALGAVVSPTDAVAASAVTERLDISGRVTHIINGEGLINDASGLVAFKFAVAAAATGSFSAGKAALSFVVLSAGGILAGLAVAWVVGQVRVWLVCREISEPSIQTTLSLLTPFAAYFLAEQLEVSGILAVVAAGVYAGLHDTRHLTTEDRIQTWEVWTVVLFGLNGLAFVLLGVRLPEVLGGVAAEAPGLGWGHLALYAAAVSAAVIALRIAWVFPGAYLPRRLFRGVREQEPAPTPGNVFIVGWCGLRGSVNLAAALSVPLATGAGAAFPGRSLIIFLATGVIVVTLVVQGLTLPALVRRLGAPADGSEAEEERAARVAAARAAIERVGQYVIPESSEHEQAFAGELIAVYERRVRHLLAEEPEDREDLATQLKVERNLRLTALAAEAEALLDLHRTRAINEETLRKVQREIDHTVSALQAAGA
jgi:Na+/H+ antiporter